MKVHVNFSLGKADKTAQVEVKKMKTILESLMLIGFIAAICIMIFRLARETSCSPLADRIVAITMGAGFALGAVYRVFVAPLAWPLALYVLGAMLSYTATLFSFPDLGKHI